MDSEHLDLNRRELIGSAAGMGLLILKPHVVRGSQANSAIRIGLLGCGARGTAVAKSFITNTTARYVALADIFPDQLNRAKNYFDRLAEAHSYSGIDPALVFRGPQSYQELASSEKIDVVHIATPGFFHVDHLETAVVAAKHVYCEKPLGIDVVQAKRAMEIGERAEGRLSLEVGFQIRSAPPFIELVRRIHKNAIGPVACISAHYHATAMTYPARSPMSHDELRLRNWYWDHILSGAYWWTKTFTFLISATGC
jgi:myo-inositol 2-dehydrogenase/D-chiro-inositol 1-dehydrogenase